MPKLEPPSMDSVHGGCRFVEDAYEILTQVGEGTYGQVYMAEDRITKDRVALKKIRMDNEKDGFPITAIREIKILRATDDDNVIGVREIVRSKGICSNAGERGGKGVQAGGKCSIYMVFDFMDHDLTGLLERLNYRLPLPQVKHFMKQLLKGLHSCHRNGILHRDLKLSNLLIDCEGNLKLADFGLARPYKDMPDSRMTNRVITLWYRPPELLMGAEKYGPAIDMWSVGCIFAELLTGKPIFPGKDEADQLDKVFWLLGSPTEENFPGCQKLEHYHKIPTTRHRRSRIREWCEKNGVEQYAGSLLQALLTLDPMRRPSAEKALLDPFFWHEPEAQRPVGLQKLAPSHEYTMKRKRQEGGGARSPKRPHQGDKRGY